MFGMFKKRDKAQPQETAPSSNLTNELSTIENVMKPAEIYLTTHHENTTSVNNYKTNWARIAVALCIEKSIPRENIMLTYLETMSWKWTWWLPNMVVKIWRISQPVVNHFTTILKWYVNWLINNETAKENIDTLLHTIIWKEPEIKNKNWKQRITYDRQNRLYKKVKDEISAMDQDECIQYGKDLVKRRWIEPKENFDFWQNYRNYLLHNEYLRQRVIFSRIMYYWFSDAILHVKDAMRNWTSRDELTDKEFKSMVLASFQNGVLTSASKKYSTIDQSHEDFKVRTRNVFWKWGIEIVHIPLSTNTNLSSTISSWWEAIIESETFWSEFVEYCINNRINWGWGKDIQWWFVRYNWKKTAFKISNSQWRIDLLIWKEMFDANDLLRLIVTWKLGDIKLMIFQDILDFIPMLLGNVNHIGSERWVRKKISELLTGRLQWKWVPTNQIEWLVNKIMNNRHVWDEPSSKAVPADRQALESYKDWLKSKWNLAPVSVSHAWETLNDAVLGDYSEELIKNLHSDSSWYNLLSPWEKESIIHNRYKE